MVQPGQMLSSGTLFRAILCLLVNCVTQWMAVLLLLYESEDEQ